jgi:hypothetical protein
MSMLICDSINISDAYVSSSFSVKNLVITGIATAQQSISCGSTLAVSSSSTLSGVVSCGTSLSVNGLATFSSGCVLPNSQAVSTSASNTLNYYTQGLSWTYNINVGGTTVSVNLSVIRVGNLVVIHLEPWTLETSSEGYTLTGFTNILTGYSWGELSSNKYSSVICSSNGAPTLVVAELTTANTLNIYPASNLSGTFSGTVVMPSVNWVVDLTVE